MIEQTLEGAGNQTPTETQPEGTGQTNIDEDTGLNPLQWETEKADLLKEKEDWQKKFSDSARGAQSLLDENKLLKVKLEETSSKSFSDEEFSKQIPNWDYMSDGEKEVSKRTMLLEKQMVSHSTLLNKLTEEKAWEADFNKTLKGNPSLKDYQDEFKEYAYQNIDVKNLNILAKAFLLDKQPSIPAKSKAGLEKPSGGTKIFSSGKMSSEEIEQLRTSDYRRYKELLQQGKI